MFWSIKCILVGHIKLALLKMKNKQTLIYYLLTLLMLLIGGALLSVILSFIKNDNHILILILVGTLFATIACSILNLMYFLPQSFNKYKFVVPGILSVIIVAFEYRMNITELMIFEFYGVTNLLLGVIWTSKINLQLKQKKTNLL